MMASSEDVDVHVRAITNSKTPKELEEAYNKWGATYDKDIQTLGYAGPQLAAEAVLEFCPGAVDSVSILDVGAGTGLVGKELQKLGFRIIDGIDPSQGMYEIAKSRNIYRKYIRGYFTKDPLDMPENSYDIIVSCGTFWQAHLPYDCFYEMIRLVRPGGIICLVTRNTIFDGDSIPEYRNRITPLLQQLEADRQWKLRKWETTAKYHNIHNEGVIIIYEVC